MKNRRKRRGTGLLIVAFIVLAVFLGFLVLRKYESRRVQPVVPPQTQQAGTVPVVLFFANPNGDGLAREGREIEACPSPEECALSVVEELINGPVGDLEPVLPPAATVQGVRIVGDTARVDLGKETVEALPAGSSAELLAVYAIVNTVTANVPQIKKVQLLVDGQEAQTLKGHIDLRQPLVPDPKLEHTQPEQGTNR
jgi:spore germination protein GerM